MSIQPQPNPLHCMKEEDAFIPAGRQLRSNHTIVSDENKPARANQNKEPLPLVQYHGKIIYCTTLIDIACACDNLLKWVNSHPDAEVPLAFDMEWPFTYQTGAGRSALIQVCAELEKCYLFQISCLKKLPAVLVALLSNPKVICHGINIKNDFRKLQRDFPEVKVQKMIDQSIDLGVWFNQVSDHSQRWSMAKLVEEICQQHINKDKRVRMSKWDVVPLDENQQLYAAIDVYIAQIMYFDIKKRQLAEIHKAQLNPNVPKEVKNLQF